jgi:hypothetical protein
VGNMKPSQAGRPPSVCDASMMSVGRPAPRHCRAAVMPARPPPTITTVGAGAWRSLADSAISPPAIVLRLCCWPARGGRLAPARPTRPSATLRRRAPARTLDNSVPDDILSSLCAQQSLGTSGQHSMEYPPGRCRQRLGAVGLSRRLGSLLRGMSGGVSRHVLDKGQYDYSLGATDGRL